VAHPELKPRQGTPYSYPFCHLFPSYPPRLLSEPLPPALFPNGQRCKLPPRVSAEVGRKRISMHFEVTTTNLTDFKDTKLPTRTHQEMRLRACFTQCARKLPEFAEITQNNGHYAVQHHSRSPILVPTESSYTNSY